MNIRILPVAQREIDKAAEWYERQREGVGFTFLDHIDQSLDKIALKQTVIERCLERTGVAPSTNSHMLYGSKSKTM